jgi:hypothetical protein
MFFRFYGSRDCLSTQILDDNAPAWDVPGREEQARLCGDAAFLILKE